MARQARFGTVRLGEARRGMAGKVRCVKASQGGVWCGMAGEVRCGLVRHGAVWQVKVWHGRGHRENRKESGHWFTKLRDITDGTHTSTKYLRRQQDP